ncbi:MAG: hypothetical protein HY924_03035 [Elusimicrobia bacterium]|nr:hypothetical protein [Elusimicrobiota bacterium]
MSGLGSRLAWLAALLCVPAGVGWAQHGGHGGHAGHESGPVSISRDDEDRAERRSRLEKLERLGEKIEEIDAELAKPDTTAKRRAKLEKKLKKLLAQRDRILPTDREPIEPPVAMPSPAAGEVYACPMKDYSGPGTKDGRCPQCGMALSKIVRSQGQGGGEARPSTGPACGKTGEGSDICAP